MSWPPTAQDRERAFKEDGAWFLNHYRCGSCKRRWTDEWSCTCDDDCPSCGATNSPVSSDELEGPNA
jgi:hypothetical protein